MSINQIYINGRFLQKSVTGTERFAREIVSELDTLLESYTDRLKVNIIAPQGTPSPKGLKVIKFQTCGKFQGHAWEQWDLFRETRKGTLLNFTNSGPILHSNQMVVIHDVSPYRMPKDFSFAYRTFHRALGRILALRSRIATVSEFSRNELSTVLGIDRTQISVIYNGHEHSLRTAPDHTIIAKLGLEERPFFLFVGSPVPRKNLSMAIQAFHALKRGDIAFVIVGASNSKVFKEGPDIRSQNVILPGRLKDEEIIALYAHAHALIFPSLYEGFGIPPLEAMVQGCPVLASSIPPVQEVCGDAAHYYDPYDISDCIRCLKNFLDNLDKREIMVKKGKERYLSFSWNISAAQLLDELMQGKI